MEDNLQTLLRHGRFRLLSYRFLVALAGGCAGLFVCFGLLSLMELAWGLRENLAFALGLVAIIIPFAISVAFLIRHYRRQSSLKAMALLVEEEHPELMDSLICAYELETASAHRELRGIERELVEQVHRRLEEEPDLIISVMCKHSRGSLVLAIIAILLLGMTTRLPVVEKFLWGARALLMGDKGICLVLQGEEAARHSDYSLQATLLRWEQQADVVIDAQDGSHARYAMNRMQDGSFVFTFYDVSQNFRFRLLTPSLSTPWQQISVYDPPAYEELRMEVKPLPYMRRENRSFQELSDVELVAGETINLAVKTAPGVTASLQWENNQEALAVQENGWQQISFTPAKDTPCELHLENQDGHTSSHTMEITVIPDLPPVLALLEPTKDVTRKPGDFLRILAQLSDDFGLQECLLLYSVNGGERKSISLRKAESEEPEKEWEITSQWNLPELNLQVGDLLSCMLVAEDNRIPKPQRAKSDLFFIVIRPDQDSVDSESQQQGEEKKANVSDLIAESKRLMRLSWDILGMEPSTLRDRSEKELVVGLNELELEVRKRVTSIAKDVGGNLGEPLTSLFQQVSEQLLAASKLAERKLFEESISPQERALTALVAIETELIKNAMKSQKGKGEDAQKGEGEEKKQENSSEQQQTASKPDLKALKEMIEELRKIISRQESINGSLARENTLLDSLAGQQRKNQTATNTLNERIEPNKELGQVANALKNAISEMNGGIEALDTGNRQVGGIHGARARMQLVAGLRMLEEALRRESSSEVKRLSEMAAQLAESQRQEAQNSQELSKQQKPDDQATTGAKERQNALNNATQRLKQEIQEAVGELQEEYPKATDAMTEALRQADSKGLQRAQTRAKNALLYKRFDRASREQNDASNFLQELANALHSAAESMPSMGEQELREMLEQLQNAASQMQNAMQSDNQNQARQQMEEAREQAARITDEAAQATKNRRLQEISSNLAFSANGENPSEAGQVILRNIAEAAAILGNMLDDIAREKQRQLLRRSSAPPERYRRQVEDYFRKLGNE